jgi:hypothetical protein
MLRLVPLLSVPATARKAMTELTGVLVGVGVLARTGVLFGLGVDVAGVARQVI